MNDKRSIEDKSEEDGSLRITHLTNSDIHKMLKSKILFCLRV